jgi:16S rRNA (adenine1518-N6/adenine1519-N6)-dimethyltransferase
VAVVANLPYAISTPWLDQILSGPILPSRMVLMLQKEAALRYLAVPGSKRFGAISIFLNSAYAARDEVSVSANCFYPRPDVDSVLLHLERRATPLRFPSTRKQAIRRVFTQRRKQLGSTARADADLGAWLFREPRVRPEMRPEEVPLEAWQSLAEPDGGKA